MRWEDWVRPWILKLTRSAQNFMQILFVSSGMRPEFGGSAHSEASLGAFLQKSAGARVFCPEGKYDSEFGEAHGLSQVEFYTPQDARSAWLRNVAPIADAIQHADVVHFNGHWDWKTPLLARACVRHQKPYILHPRGMLLVGHRRHRLKQLYNGLLGNRFVREAAHVISLSRFELRQFAPYAISPDKATVIPNGFDVARALSPAPAESPYFLYMGRLERRKNLLFLVDAYAEYVRRGGQAKLVFLGPVERGYDAEIWRRAKEREVSAALSIYPPSYGQEKLNWMRRSLGLIYPAVEEPFGRVPFEAVLAGTQPIVPEESGSSEYLKPFFPHNIFRLENVDDLTQVLRDTEAGANHSRPAIEKAQQWMKEVMGWSSIGNRVLLLYQEVLSKRSVTPPVERDLGAGGLAKRSAH